MVYINEWFPNPVGADAVGEFIELYNDGSSAIKLDGWYLQATAKKKFFLTGRSIPAHGHLVLKTSVTKLSLRNTDGELFLYRADGTAADRGKFFGSAPEGQSFSRADYDAGPAQHFAFAEPTPGAPNAAAAAVIAVRAYPVGIPINRHLESWEFFAIMMGTAVLIAGIIFYATKTNEDLSKLFFGRDERVW